MVDAFSGRFGARLMSTFSRHGMVSIMVLADGTQVDVGFEEGGQVELDGVVHVIERSVEYLAASATLTRGMLVTVAGKSFKVKRQPDPKDDGTFCIAYLEPSSS